MRLDKFLAHCGLGTRKEVRQIIKKKQVHVNQNTVTDVGFNIDEQQDYVEVNGVPCQYEEYIYLMMNKQAGVISAREDKYETTIFSELDSYYYHRGVFPVGRLDKDTTGLLLLTNDGALAHQLLSPKKHVDKQYYVTLASSLTDANIEQLEIGITLSDGYQCLPAKVEMLSENEMHLTIQEGKFHQVKRMMLACNNEVLKLKRVRMGTLQLDDSLLAGEVRVLTDVEKDRLFREIAFSKIEN